jgi:multidrug resistance efflux pump
MLDDAKARLTTLDAQIMLTQRTIKAQEYNAQSVNAAVERAKALVKQTTSSRIRLEPLVPQGLPHKKIWIRRERPKKRRAPNWRPPCCRRNRLPPP